MITNKQLVSFCESMLGEAYWWGTFNNTCTQSLYEKKKKQYPTYYDQSKYKVSFSDQINKKMKCTDCVGLIKAAIWCNGNKNNTPTYNASQDVNVSGMLSKCTEKGKIATIPETPGVLVFYSGHVGVYIGSGYVIEAKGHDYGVVKTKLAGRGWTDWGKCPWVDYSGETTTKVQSENTVKSSSSISFTHKIIKAVNVRAGHGTSYKKISYKDFPDYIKKQTVSTVTCLPAGVKIHVYNTVNGWYKIDKEKNIWIAGNYAEKI